MKIGAPDPDPTSGTPPIRPVGFTSTHAGGGMAVMSCDVCGAVVIDFPKNRDGWTRERPNQDRHRRWHEQA